MKNKVIITGAGRGIGLETAKIFHNQNWDVISIDKFFTATKPPKLFVIFFKLIII